MCKRKVGIRELEKVSAERGGTYDELALAGEVAVADADEGVVVLALAERRGVDVGREEADGGEDALVEGGLVGVGDVIVFFLFRLLGEMGDVYVP